MGRLMGEERERGGFGIEEGRARFGGRWEGS